MSGWTVDELLGLIDGMRHGNPQAVRTGLNRVCHAARQFDRSYDQADLTDIFVEWSADEYRSVLGIPSSAEIRAAR